jgi:hypothetical protein
LSFNSIFRNSKELFDPQMLFDPFVNGRDTMSQKWSFKIEPPGSGVGFNDT